MRNALQAKRLAYAVLIVAGALAVTAGASPVHAQGFNFQNFNSTNITNLTLNGHNGSPALFGSVLRLTPTTTQHRAGSAWFNTAQSVQQGFTTTFQFRISNDNSAVGGFPADGFAFVIQNSGLSAIGGSGGAIGYGDGGSEGPDAGAGISNSLALEFDTFQNGYDLDNNHVAAQSCGTAANTADHNNESCFIARQSLNTITLADGNVHTVIINYDFPSCSECTTGTLKVYVDGNAPVLSTTVPNLSTFLGLGESGTAFVGFTGAVGALVENNDILNWSFSPHSGTTTNAILHFTPGTNVSQIANFHCSESCSVDPANSIKLTVSLVKKQFDLVVSATEVQGNGFCPSGHPDTDFDCRYAQFFGTPANTDTFSTLSFNSSFSGAVNVPLCNANVNGNCVFYRIENPPAGSAFNGPVFEYIAWNNTPICNPSLYQCTNPQMYDDPSAPPFNNDHQFARIITTYFNDGGGQVGLDPGVGGRTDDFNDFQVSYPQTTGSSLTFILLPPLSQTSTKSFQRGSTIPVKFQLKQGNIFINNAATPPNHVGLAVLDSNNVSQPVNPRGGSKFFRFRGNHYQFNLCTAPYKPGTYKLQIDSNLFSQQFIQFTVTGGGDGGDNQGCKDDNEKDD